MYIYFFICLFAGIHVCTASVSPYVVGGSFAKQDDFPFVCSIRNKSNDRFVCAGTIIDKSWIVTAAECVTATNASNLSVVVGTTDLFGGGQHFNVSLISIHPNYNSTTKANNIALLKLSKALTENKQVSTIKIAKDIISDGKTVELAGWGSTNPSQGFANNLLWVELETIKQTDCELLLPNIFYYNICTAGKFNKGACTYDNGSPLIQRGSLFTSTELHGIVSQYYNCANGKPDVYLSVTAFRYWIEQEIKK